MNKMDKELSEIVSGMLGLADAADAAGTPEVADAIAGVLPSMGLLKTAQYEGVQHYHLMNGRAFEKAWKEKRKKKPTDDSQYHFENDGNDYYKSAHDCWWDVLEEYQDALMGNHEEWLKRYASSEPMSIEAYAKKKGEVEEGSGTASPGATMSKEMTDEAKKRQDGKGVQEWLEEGGMPLPALRSAANTILINKIGEKVAAGEMVGVAFYEAMDYCLSGDYKKDIVSSAKSALELAAKSKDKKISKEAQHYLGRLMNWFSQAPEKAKEWYGKGKEMVGKGVDWAKGKMDAANRFQAMQPHAEQAKAVIDNMLQNPAEAANMLQQLYGHISALQESVVNYGQIPQIAPGPQQPAQQQPQQQVPQQPQAAAPAAGPAQMVPGQPAPAAAAAQPQAGPRALAL